MDRAISPLNESIVELIELDFGRLAIVVRILSAASKSSFCWKDIETY